MKETLALLTPNKWSRPRNQHVNVQGLVVHWVENAGSSAMLNRDYFESRKTGILGYGSAHDIIGLDGEVVHCIPYDEMAYHVGAATYLPDAVALWGDYPNATTLGIEWTHPDWTGKPTPETLTAGRELFARLCVTFHLDPLTRIRCHSQVTGKVTPRGPCHKYFMEHPEAMADFCQSVLDEIGDGV